MAKSRKGTERKGVTRAKNGRGESKMTRMRRAMLKRRLRMGGRCVCRAGSGDWWYLIHLIQRTLHLAQMNEYVLVSSDLGRRRLTGIETKFSEQSSTVRKAASRGKGGIWSVRVTAGKAHGGVQGVTARLQELTIGLSTSERKCTNTVC